MANDESPRHHFIPEEERYDPWLPALPARLL